MIDQIKKNKQICQRALVSLQKHLEES